MLPEGDVTGEVLRGSPLEGDDPDVVGPAAVGDSGLEPVPAVKVLRLGQVVGVRQVGDVPVHTSVRHLMFFNVRDGNEGKYRRDPIQYNITLPYQVPRCGSVSLSARSRNPLNAERLLMVTLK